MPLIPVVGRRSPKMRLLLGFIYFLLCAGAVTTVYPFMVMLSASVASDYDQNAYTLIPEYLVSDKALVAKYVEDKYNADLIALNRAYGTNYASLQDLTVNANSNAAATLPKWDTFFARQGASYRVVGFMGPHGQYVPSKLLERYRSWLRDKFHGDVHAMSSQYTEEDTNFLSVFPPYERPLQRFFAPKSSAPKDRDWSDFQAQLPIEWFQPVLCDPLYQAYLHDEAYPSGKIADLNAAWGTKFTDFSQIKLAASPQSQSAQAKCWTDFVRRKLPLRFISWTPEAQMDWLKFGGVGPLPTNAQLPSGPILRKYAAFVSQANPNMMRVRSLESLWRTYIGDPSATIPAAEEDREYALAHKGEIRREFLARNYKFALDYLLLHGRGLLNTAIYCAGAVLVAIIVNPLCAYALSRFRMPQATSLLLFLLATMAFPAEITMIPNFLLLKQLGLLNTFAALILPSAASGYSIFLLKGFFDSLPMELYEAGMLDGASDLTLFTRVTLPLSGPIFAVIALNAFTSAYGAFLFAMVVAQAQSHWTLMVWIYEFQALSAPQYVIMAALVIAALPTLVVFLLAQNVIMKGIILPSYK